jgi:bacterioferritin (cytochrome b1)
MSLGKPEVIDALNVLLTSEITLHEVAHAWEKVFKCHGYKELRRWFCAQIDSSGKRRLFLEKRIVLLGGIVRLSMVPAVVDPSTEIDVVIADSSRFFLSILDEYRIAWDVVSKAGDYTTASDLCQRQKCVERAIFELESFALQISDIGISAWTQSLL